MSADTGVPAAQAAPRPGSFHEAMLAYLTERGLLPSQAQDIFEQLRAHPASAAMNGRWSDLVTDYPPAMMAVTILGLREEAVKWLNEHCPEHWAKSLFEPLPPTPPDQETAGPHVDESKPKTIGSLVIDCLMSYGSTEAAARAFAEAWRNTDDASSVAAHWDRPLEEWVTVPMEQVMGMIEHLTVKKSSDPALSELLDQNVRFRMAAFAAS